MANTGALGTPGATQSTPQGFMSPLSQATASALGSTNVGTAIGAETAGQYLPAYGQSALQGAVAGQGLATDIPNANVAASELGVTTGQSLGQSLLGYENVGLQEAGLQSQMGTAAAQQGVERQQFGVQQTQYPEQLQEAALSNALAVTGNRDQGAISGSLGGQGYKRQQSAQAAQYGWQQADIYRNQQLATLQQKSEELGYGGQEAQYANQMQQLGLSAKSQGLNAQDAYQQLSFGLNQIGVQASPEQYLQAISSAQGGAQQQLQAGMAQANLYGGLPAGYGLGG